MTLSSLVLNYTGQLDYALEINLPGRQVYRHIFSMAYPTHDVTYILSLDNLQKDRNFMLLYQAGTFTTTYTPGTDDIYQNAFLDGALPDSAVATADITDAAVTTAKLATGANSGVLSRTVTAGEAILIGAPVSCADSSGTAKFYNADADGAAARQIFMGFSRTAAAADLSTFTLQTAGEIDVPDARWQALPAVTDVGAPVYLYTTSGQVTITKPTASAVNPIRVGVVTRGATGAVRIQIQQGEGGKVTGPGGTADNVMARFDGVTGYILQGSNRSMGDTGIATTITGANGSTMVDGFLTELHTLAAAATSDTTIQIPAGAVVTHVTGRVTTLITGATSFDVGVAGATSRYGDDVAVAATTTFVGPDPRAYTAATSIRFTANGSNFTAGVVRVDIHYKLATAPTS